MMPTRPRVPLMDSAVGRSIVRTYRRTAQRSSDGSASPANPRKAGARPFLPSIRGHKWTNTLDSTCTSAWPIAAESVRWSGSFRP